ncbi:MAG: hypothetical protein H0U54_16030 [Acidobacteria bacterium]|nr:hypothetical protein [Acidobacteriota bacterium]
MAKIEDYEPTDEWLEQINEELRKRDVPHKQRPYDALMEWSKYAGISSSLGGEDEKKIFDWFEKNTKVGSQYFGPMYMGSLFYDSCFWPIFIPVVCGEVKLDASNSLKTLPDSIKARLMKDKQEFMQYVAVWVDCIDYGFGIEELVENKNISTFGQELFRSGNQQLNATVSLLHEDNPNAKAMESARMATEMFLKAFLASKSGLTEKKAKDKIGHNLEKALNMCLDVDGNSELQVIHLGLPLFPEIKDRYKGTDKTLKELWHGYGIAQFTGTTVVRSLTGRDVRKTLK